MFRILAVLLPIIFCCCSCSIKEHPVGSKERPFTIYFIPSADAQTMILYSEGIGEFVGKYLSQELYGKDEGFHVKTAVPSSYIAVIEAFGARRADFCNMNTFGYVLARDIKQYPIEPLFSVVRNESERTYKGQIIVPGRQWHQQPAGPQRKEICF